MANVTYGDAVQDAYAAEKAAKRAEMDPPVVVSLRRLGNTGDELAATITALEERLQFVLAQPTPEPSFAGSDDVQLQHGDSELTNQIHAHAHNTEQQVYRLRRLLNRLEL